MEVDEILHGNQNTLLIVRRDDLIDFATAYADRIISELPKPALKPEPEKPIPQPEAMEFLGKSRQTFIKWRKKGFITGHSLGGRVYYFKSELLSALNKKSA